MERKKKRSKEKNIRNEKDGKLEDRGKMKYSGLSEKRKEVLRVIDRHGILTREQLLKRVDIAYKNMVYAVKQLEELGYIATYKLARGYAHYITKKGSEYIGLINFGYVSSGGSPNLAILEHNLLVNDCILEATADIRKHLGDIRVDIVTEREQLAEIMLNIDLSRLKPEERRRNKLRERNRVPDFLLAFKNQKEQKIVSAYEVELSRKTIQRLRGKLLWYKQQLEKNVYTHIWYMYEKDAIRRHIETNAHKVNLPVQFLEIDNKRSDY